MTHFQKSLLMCTLAGLSLSTSFYVPTHATEVSAPTTTVPATQAPSQVQPSDSKPLVDEQSPQRSYFSYIKSSIAPLLKFCGMCYFGFLAKNNFYRSRRETLKIPLYTDNTTGPAVKVPHEHKVLYFHISMLEAFITTYLAKSLYSDYCNYQPSSHTAPVVAQ